MADNVSRTAKCPPQIVPSYLWKVVPFGSPDTHRNIVDHEIVLFLFIHMLNKIILILAVNRHTNTVYELEDLII